MAILKLFSFVIAGLSSKTSDNGCSVDAELGNCALLCCGEVKSTGEGDMGGESGKGVDSGERTPLGTDTRRGLGDGA